MPADLALASDLPPTQPGPEPVRLRVWEQVVPRQLDPADWVRFETYTAEILSAFGLDLGTPGTQDTPRRLLRALYDATDGYEGDPKLLTVFPAEGEARPAPLNQIIEGPVRFYALCEHHALPFHGVAHVGYTADQQIIGISKLTRLVRLFARRFTVQERMGEQIADTLVGMLAPHGVAVRLQAEHLCTQMRGVREEHSTTVTSFWRGTYEQEPELRREFLSETRAAGGR